MAKSHRICSVHDCGKKHCAKGYCLAHLRKFNKYGDPLVGRTSADMMPRGVPCVVEGCGKPSVRRGYCAMHNKRIIRHGDANGGRWILGEREAWLKSHVVYASNECLLWPYASGSNGYGSVYWRGRQTSPHRIMCLLAHGEPLNEAKQAAHSCNNRRCVNPHHLRWATPQENSMDKHEHGTMLVGEKNPQHVLTEDQVRAIRALQGKVMLREVAGQFGIHIGTVWHIWARKTWAWLK